MKWSEVSLFIIRIAHTLVPLPEGSGNGNSDSFVLLGAVEAEAEEEL